MLGKQPQTICFNGFILDLSRGCVRRGDKEIRLRPKSFDVLQYLVRNQGRLISKQEVIRAVWADAFVTDNSLVQCMIEIRRSLGDAAQTMIRTIPRRGYIFDIPVTAASAAEEDRQSAEGATEQNPVAIAPTGARGHYLFVVVGPNYSCNASFGGCFGFRQDTRTNCRSALGQHSYNRSIAARRTFECARTGLFRRRND